MGDNRGQGAILAGLVPDDIKNVNVSGGKVQGTRSGDNLSPVPEPVCARRRNSLLHSELQVGTKWRHDGDNHSPPYRGRVYSKERRCLNRHMGMTCGGIGER